MAVIYLRHPVHGEKVASSQMEAEHDREHGWVDFDPTVKEAPAAAPPAPVVLEQPIVPDFLAPEPKVEEPVSDLPEDFPGRDDLIKGGFPTWESVVGLTRDELIAVKGIGPKTADAILEVMES